MRQITLKDKERAGFWLDEAQRSLRWDEFYRVKQLCKQVIRVLERKEKDVAKK